MQYKIQCKEERTRHNFILVHPKTRAMFSPLKQKQLKS